MNSRKALQALERHVKDEGRIHKELIHGFSGELMKDIGTDIKKLARRHWRDTKEIHQQLFRDLKKAWTAKR